MIPLETRIEQYFDRLWPLNRSISGPGYRASLDILSEIIPLERHLFPSGMQVFDWTVPKEWDVREAYFLDPHGKRHADVSTNNLHLVSYSIPFHGKVDLPELKRHLYSLPHKPSAVPYVTSYYRPSWGFCLAHEELSRLPEGEYHVHIDSSHYDGAVVVGEAVLPGVSSEEILFSSYLCHPSMANNELSGPLVLAFLYEALKSLPTRRFTYRFVLNPETIGSICYLHLRGKELQERLRAGFVLTCIGDREPIKYKRSRRGDSLGDQAAELVVRDFGSSEFLRFDPSDGSDERQYCSPGFNLPVGSLMRARYLSFPEYHTSLDDKKLISFQKLADSVRICQRIVETLELNGVFRNTVRFCEPQLGKRNLYPTISGAKEALEARVQATMWLLNYSDGSHSLIDIAKMSGHAVPLLRELAQTLTQGGLLEQLKG